MNQKEINRVRYFTVNKLSSNKYKDVLNYKLDL